MKKTIFIFWGCILISLCACGKKETTVEAELSVEKTAESLVEDIVELTWDAGTVAEEMTVLDDGRWIIWGTGGKMFVSKDEGATWKPEENKNYQEWFEKWKDKNLIAYTAISKEESIMSGVTYFRNTKEDGTLNFSNLGDQIWEYYYSPKNGEIKTGQVTFPKDDYLQKIWFSKQGELFIHTMKHIYKFDPDSNKQEVLMEQDKIVTACMSGNIILALDGESVYLYDYQKGEMLEHDAVLDGFIKLKMENSVNICIKDGEGKAIYILCEDGLYRHILGGNSIEVIFEKSNNFLQVSMKQGFQMSIMKPGKFYFPMTNGKLLHLKYGKEEAKEVIEVYNLIEEFEPRYAFTRRELETALRKYEIAHPEIKIRYRIGVLEQAEGSVTKEDIIKNLNMELLAGKGPDILILNDLPVSNYIEKGVLADISDIVNKIDKEEGILPNILDDYKQENGSIYHIPLGFNINVVSMPKEITKNNYNLTELADAMEILKSEEEYVMFVDNFPPSLIAHFAPTCSNSWVNEEGDINEENLLEFFEQMKRIYQMNIEKEMLLGRGEYIQEKDYEELEKILTQNTTKYTGEIFPTVLYAGEKVQQSYGIGECGGKASYTFVNLFGHKSEMDYAQFNGQCENIYNPKNIIGINSNSPKKARAKEVVQYLLSAESKYGMDETGYKCPSISINIKNIEEKDSLVQGEFGASEEQMQRLEDIIKNVEEPYKENKVLLNEVIRAGAKVLWKDATPKEAVEEVKNKLEILSME